MTILAWKPWHQVVQLRDDLKAGELSRNQFAADLYEVLMKRGERPIYENPVEFFALTYPTYNLRQLAREVVLRLAGQNDKAVRQLALTYGGGKTHTLITLDHLVTDPEHLPDLPAVHEFVTEIGMTPPKARWQPCVPTSSTWKRAWKFAALAARPAGSSSRGACWRIRSVGMRG